MSETAAIVLAAGKSTRMRSARPKVLHELCGRPMLGYVLSACRLAGVDRLITVVGHGKKEVMDCFAAERDVTWVEQSRQLGTGDAVACCRKAMAGLTGGVIVIAGDMPLVRRDTVEELLKQREASGDALVLATTTLDDPTGYGRIVRDSSGALVAIVEQQDCSDEQLAIGEVNVSYYCFDAQRLFDVLGPMKSARKRSELYLTDAVQHLREAGHGVSAGLAMEPEDAIGINTRLDLARVARIMQDRIQLRLMNDGVSIVDPDTTWIEADVSVGCDTTIHPFSFVGLGATIGEGCVVGPHGHVGAGETLEDGDVAPATVGQEVSAS